MIGGCTAGRHKWTTFDATTARLQPQGTMCGTNEACERGRRPEWARAVARYCVLCHRASEQSECRGLLRAHWTAARSRGRIGRTLPWSKAPGWFSAPANMWWGSINRTDTPRRAAAHPTSAMRPSMARPALALTREAAELRLALLFKASPHAIVSCSVWVSNPSPPIWTPPKSGSNGFRCGRPSLTRVHRARPHILRECPSTSLGPGTARTLARP
jgi:hypothetical protein